MGMAQRQVAQHFCRFGEPPYFQGGLSALEGVLYTYVPNTNQHFVVGTHVEQGNLIHPTD